MPAIDSFLRVLSWSTTKVFGAFLLCLVGPNNLLWTADLPNIVYILADDLGYGDLGCYNPASKIPTPRLDQLAMQGMRFTDAHSPSSVCTPTRYALLTGRYAWRTRLQKNVLGPWDKPLIAADRLTVGKLLQQKGTKQHALENGISVKIMSLRTGNRSLADLRMPEQCGLQPTHR